MAGTLVNSVQKGVIHRNPKAGGKSENVVSKNTVLKLKKQKIQKYQEK